MEGNHVSWLYPARPDAPQGRQLSDAGPRIRSRFRLLTRDLFRIRRIQSAATVEIADARNQVARTASAIVARQRRMLRRGGNMKGLVALACLFGSVQAPTPPDTAVKSVRISVRPVA